MFIMAPPPPLSPQQAMQMYPQAPMLAASGEPLLLLRPAQTSRGGRRGQQQTQVATTPTASGSQSARAFPPLSSAAAASTWPAVGAYGWSPSAPAPAPVAPAPLVVPPAALASPPGFSPWATSPSSGAGGMGGLGGGAESHPAQLQHTMLSNAARHASPAQVQSLLASPLPARVVQAMRAHDAAAAGDPLAHLAPPPPLVQQRWQQQQQQQQQQAYQQQPQQQQQPGPSSVPSSGPAQLVLPLEFVQQQQQKLFAAQQAHLAQTGRSDHVVGSPLFTPPAAHTHRVHSHSRDHGHGHARSSSNPFGTTRRVSPMRPGTAAASTLSSSPSPSPFSPSAPHYVPARMDDLGYDHSKRRQDTMVSLLARAARNQTDRSAAVQLEMRGSVRFDTSNPKAIFDALRAQASAPLSGQIVDYNEKRQVRFRDGTVSTVFGRLLERPDSVRVASISQFFVQRAELERPLTLERFASTNFARDARVNMREQMKAERHNKDARVFERKARIERTDEELLQCEDDVLTPLERWKRDQLRLKQQKAEAADAALRAQRTRQNEALKLRLERERFEREEREARDKELAILAAKEEEERANREAERLRLYREQLGKEAEYNKQAKVDAEAAKLAEEESRKAAQEAARRKRVQSEGYNPTYMNLLTKQVLARSPADELAVLVVAKDSEKLWKIAQAKLKAEVIRVGELVRKREKQQHGRSTTTSMADGSSGDGVMELRDELRRLRGSGFVTGLEDNKIRDLERLEHEARAAYDKAAQAWEAAEIAHAQASSSSSSSARGGGGGTGSVRRTHTSSSGSGTANNSANATPTASSANLHSSPSTRSHLHHGMHPMQLAEEEEEDGGGGGDGVAEETLEDIAAARAARRRTNPRSLRWSTALTRVAAVTAFKSGLKDYTAAAAGTPRSRGRTPSRPGSRPASRPGSRGQSRANSRRASHTESMEDGTRPATSGADPGSSPDFELTLGPDGEPVYVNEKTIAIDQARQAMVNQQADFEARIKALTSFSTPSTKKKSKRSTTTAAASNKDGASASAKSPRR